MASPAPGGSDGTDARLEAAERVLDRLVAVRPLASRPVVPFASDVIRDGNALLVRRGPVLVRVRPSTEANRAVARREVSFARMLASFGVPVTPLVEPDDQPWAVLGQVVTAWSWVESSSATDAFDLGLLARTLRERSAIAVALVPEVDPLGVIVETVSHLPRRDAAATFVRRRARDLADAWTDASAQDPLGRSIVHADLHRGNVVDGAAGPVLTDLELTGAGGASYDAAPSVIGVSRYGADPASLDEFLRGFGSDPRPWNGFTTYVEVYELWATAWAVGVGDRNELWGREARRRVETLRGDADHQWRLL